MRSTHEESCLFKQGICMIWRQALFFRICLFWLHFLLTNLHFCINCNSQVTPSSLSKKGSWFGSHLFLSVVHSWFVLTQSDICVLVMENKWVPPQWDISSTSESDFFAFHIPMCIDMLFLLHHPNVFYAKPPTKMRPNHLRKPKTHHRHFSSRLISPSAPELFCKYCQKGVAARN